MWWWTWFFVFVIHLVLWVTVTVMWPITYIGSYTPLQFLRVFCYISMLGPYGGYWALLGTMIFAFII